MTNVCRECGERYSVGGAGVDGLCPSCVGKAEEPVYAVGDVVIPAPGEVLACGTGTYAFAIVASTDPLALASADGDMVWDPPCDDMKLTRLCQAAEPVVYKAVRAYMRYRDAPADREEPDAKAPKDRRPRCEFRREKYSRYLSAKNPTGLSFQKCGRRAFGRADGPAGRLVCSTCVRENKLDTTWPITPRVSK